MHRSLIVICFMCGTPICHFFHMIMHCMIHFMLLHMYDRVVMM
jgi:hypothetical protein